jgi:hypothetical protein
VYLLVALLAAAFFGAARVPPFAGRGFVDAAVMCFGANGGDSVEGRKLNIGESNCSTLYCDAIALARSRGTHVPKSEASSASTRRWRHFSHVKVLIAG